MVTFVMMFNWVLLLLMRYGGLKMPGEGILGALLPAELEPDVHESSHTKSVLASTLPANIWWRLPIFTLEKRPLDGWISKLQCRLTI